MTNGNLNSSTMSSPATIAVPQRIHSITQKYLAYTHHVIQCHDLWDQSVAEERTYDLHGEPFCQHPLPAFLFSGPDCWAGYSLDKLGEVRARNVWGGGKWHFWPQSWRDFLEQFRF